MGAALLRRPGTRSARNASASGSTRGERRTSERAWLLARGGDLCPRGTCHSLGACRMSPWTRGGPSARAIVEPFVEGYSPGGAFVFVTTAQPLHPLQTAAFASRNSWGSPERAWKPRGLATGHYARIVETRGRRLLLGSCARKSTSRKRDPVVMLARLDPRHLEAKSGSRSASQTKDEDARPRRSGPECRSPVGPESQEGVASWAGATNREFLEPARSSRPARATVVDEAGCDARCSSGVLAVHPGAAARGSGGSRAGVPRLYAGSAGDPTTNTVRRRRAASNAPPPGGRLTASGRLLVRLRHPRRDAKLRYRSNRRWPAGRRGGHGTTGSAFSSTSPHTGIANGQDRSDLRGRRRRRGREHDRVELAGEGRHPEPAPAAVVHSERGGPAPLHDLTRDHAHDPPPTAPLYKRLLRRGAPRGERPLGIRPQP